MSWKTHLQRMMELDDEDPTKWQLAEQFAHAVGGQFLQGHQVVQNRSDSEIELRGRWYDYPARLKIDLSFGSPVWELKCQNPTEATLYLHWDEDAIPNVGAFTGAAADDWDEDDGAAKYFFGRGFYLEADRSELDRALAVYQALPDTVRQALPGLMIGDRIMNFYLYGHGGSFLSYKDDVHDFADPLNHVGRGGWLTGQVIWGLSQIALQYLPPPEQAAPSGMLYKMTCAYCGTLYLWSQNQTCPNCGAPPKG